MHGPRVCAVVIAFSAATLAYPVTPSAQEARSAPQQSGAGALAQPEHKQQANDAMHTAPGRAGTDEPGSHAATTNEPVLVDGILNVPGAPRDSETAPAKHSERKAALDKLPTMAFRVALTDGQERALFEGVDKEGVAAVQIDAIITAELPLAVKLSDLPQSANELSVLKGLRYVRLPDRILLVQPANRIVVAEIRE